MDDNESYTFDDEGSPVSIEQLPSARKPPAVPRSGRSRTKQKAHTGSPKAIPREDHAEDSSGATAVLSPDQTASGSGDESMTDMFHIDGTGFDVTLSIGLEKIHWQSMNPKGSRRKRSGSLSGLFRRRKSSSGLRDSAQNSIDLNRLYGARIKRRHKAGQSENEGFVLGLGLFTIEQKDSNTLREKEVYFEHPSAEICSRWSDKLNDFLNSIEGRPKNVKMFLQAYAGEKNGRSIYKHKIGPLFETAGVAVDLTVIQHNEHIKQDMIHLNIDDFDCVIAMGGDGTVNQVLNGLMNRSQKEQEVDIKPGFTPAKALIPMGIIPIGKTNHTAYSMMGTVDPVTAALHIVFGHWSPVDVSSVYTPEQFYRWAFNCQYGFAGNVLSFMKRYSTLGKRRVDAAFLKALTSSKLRSYECDIEFIPSPYGARPDIKATCRTGCDRCIGKSSMRESGPDIVTDIVQEFDLNNSISSCESAGSVIELKQDSPWHTLKGDFMNVSMFTIPGNCEIAPQGLCKFTHLHDGCIDLVVVKSVERKEFIRFLRRHGNSKNQFDFPFVEVHRCKQIRFRPRMPKSWNYNDHDFSEIKYQMSQQERMLKKKQQHHRSVEVIDDLGFKKSGPIGFQGKSVSMYALDDSDEDEEDEDEENGVETLDAGEDCGGNADEGKTAGREQSDPPKYRYVGPQYQPTWTEQEIARRRKMARKKEEKKKAREEEKSKSVWNIDNEIHKTVELDFKVHNGLLMVCGLGVSPHTEFDDVRFGCLPA